MLGPLMIEWTTWMRSVGLSSRTIEARTGVVGLLALHTNPAACGWREVSAFLARGHLSASTRRSYYASLRAWFRWLVVIDHRVDNPTDRIPTPKVPRRAPRPVTMPQLERLLSTRMHRRTRVMIMLAAFQGLRVSEIAKVRGEDLHGRGLRVCGKGGFETTLPLHPVVAGAAARMPDIGWWFPSHTVEGKSIRGQSVSMIISDAMSRAGVPGTPHALRHYFGTQALKAANGNLRIAQELLRHASPATTAIYTLVENDELTAALEAIPVPTLARVS